MLLAACFGSVGKMQTTDTIRNHGGDHINLFLCQFCIGVQKAGKTVHYKNQDGSDIFILGWFHSRSESPLDGSFRSACVRLIFGRRS